MGNPVISHQFINMEKEKDKEEMVKNLVQKNLEGKMDSYFKKINAKSSAEIRLEYRISKNEQGKYEGAFNLLLDGKILPYKNKVPFKYVEDIVNHAFKHFKESLSNG